MSDSWSFSSVPSEETGIPVRGIFGIVSSSVSIVALVLVLSAVLVVPLARLRLAMRLVSYLNATSLVWSVINLVALVIGLVLSDHGTGAVCQLFGFLIAWFDLCTYNWVIAIAVFTLANTSPRLHCLLSFSSDWSFLLSCYLLSFLIAIVPFCGLGGYSRPAVFHSCLPNSVLVTTIFYVPLFATFLLLPLIYILIIIQSRSQYRSWHRLGSVNVRDINKAEEKKRKVLGTLAPFPIVFFLSWTPSLMFRVYVFCGGKNEDYFAVAALASSRLWGLFSSIVYSASHWVMLGRGIGYFFSIRIRGGNAFEAQMTSSDIITEYQEDSDNDTENTDSNLQTLQAPLLVEQDVLQ